jgi:hypothetical protein
MNARKSSCAPSGESGDSPSNHVYIAGEGSTLSGSPDIRTGNRQHAQRRLLSAWQTTWTHALRTDEATGSAAVPRQHDEGGVSLEGRAVIGPSIAQGALRS